MLCCNLEFREGVMWRARVNNGRLNLAVAASENGIWFQRRGGECMSTFSIRQDHNPAFPPASKSNEEGEEVCFGGISNPIVLSSGESKNFQASLSSATVTVRVCWGNGKEEGDFLSLEWILESFSVWNILRLMSLFPSCLESGESQSSVSFPSHSVEPRTEKY